MRVGAEQAIETKQRRAFGLSFGVTTLKLASIHFDGRFRLIKASITSHSPHTLPESRAHPLLPPLRLPFFPERRGTWPLFCTSFGSFGALPNNHLRGCHACAFALLKAGLDCPKPPPPKPPGAWLWPNPPYAGMDPAPPKGENGLDPTPPKPPPAACPLPSPPPPPNAENGVFVTFVAALPNGLEATADKAEGCPMVADCPNLACCPKLED